MRPMGDDESYVPNEVDISTRPLMMQHGQTEAEHVHCHAHNSKDILPIILTFGVGMGALLFGYNVGMLAFRV